MFPLFNESIDVIKPTTLTCSICIKNLYKLNLNVIHNNSYKVHVQVIHQSNWCSHTKQCLSTQVLFYITPEMISVMITSFAQPLFPLLPPTTTSLSSDN